MISFQTNFGTGCRCPFGRCAASCTGCGARNEETDGCAREQCRPAPACTEERVGGERLAEQVAGESVFSVLDAAAGLASVLCRCVQDGFSDGSLAGLARAFEECSEMAARAADAVVDCAFLRRGSVPGHKEPCAPDADGRAPVRNQMDNDRVRQGTPCPWREDGSDGSCSGPTAFSHP